MKRLEIVSALAAAVAAAILFTGAAQASQPVAGQLITGYVTAVQGSDAIVINGQTYTVVPGSAAQQELSSLSPGQRVDAQLNGPASSPDSEVINVAVHEGE